MMKKITLLTFLFLVSLGYSQELVTNGGFETGVATPWYGNAANPVDDGSGNFVNQAEITATGEAYDVNLSQEIILDNGKSYELSFVAYTDAATGTRGMVVGFGQTGSPFATSLVNPNPILTATPQTFTYILPISYGDAVTDRVLFDMGAELGFVFIDDVSVQEKIDLCNDGTLNNGETEIDCGGPNCGPCPSPPTVAAPTPPARDAADVVSIYSDAYATIPDIKYDAGFCGAGSVSEITVEDNPLFAYNDKECQGIDFSASTQDITGLTNLHVDIFIEAGTDLVGKVFNILIVHPEGSGDTPVNIDLNGLSPAPVPGTWYSFDREVTFNNPIVRQVTVVTNLKNDVWYDNLYLHNTEVLGVNDQTLSQFSIFPNPTGNVWNVESTEIIKKVQLFDILGKTVMTLKPNTSEVKIDASKMSKGLYFANFTTESGSGSMKLIKK